MDHDDGNRKNVTLNFTSEPLELGIETVVFNSGKREYVLVTTIAKYDDDYRLLL